MKNKKTLYLITLTLALVLYIIDIILKLTTSHDTFVLTLAGTVFLLCSVYFRNQQNKDNKDNEKKK